MSRKNDKPNARQIDYLTAYMAAHPDMARRKLKNDEQHAKQLISRKWLQLTKHLNALGPVKRTTEKWKKTWTDLKYHACRKQREMPPQQAIAGGSSDAGSPSPSALPNIGPSHCNDLWRKIFGHWAGRQTECGGKSPRAIKSSNLEDEDEFDAAKDGGAGAHEDAEPPQPPQHPHQHVIVEQRPAATLFVKAEINDDVVDAVNDPEIKIEDDTTDVDDDDDDDGLLLSADDPLRYKCTSRKNDKPNARQMNYLTAYMAEHPDMARRRLRNDEQQYGGTHELTYRKWLQLTKRLNALGPVQRTTEKWKKTWTDLKYYACKKLREMPQRAIGETSAGDILPNFGPQHSTELWRKIFGHWASQEQTDCGDKSQRAIIGSILEERLLALRNEHDDDDEEFGAGAHADEKPPPPLHQYDIQAIKIEKGGDDGSTGLSTDGIRSKSMRRLRGLFVQRLHGFAGECERQLERDIRASLAAAAPILGDQLLGRLMACVRDALEQQIGELCERLLEDVQQRSAAGAAAADVAGDEGQRDPDGDHLCSDWQTDAADERRCGTAAVDVNDDMGFDCPKDPPTTAVERRIEVNLEKLNIKRAAATQNQSFACDICPAIFSRKPALTEHMLRHSGTKKYMCEYCSRPFRHSASFRQHLRWHRNRREFVCDQCPAAFNNTAALRKHQAVHTGQKPYRCPRCPRAERHRLAIVRHLLRDHGVALTDMDEVFPRKLGYWQERQKRKHAAGGQAVSASGEPPPTMTASSSASTDESRAGAGCSTL